MAKQIRKGGRVSTRHSFPMVEMMNAESRNNLFFVGMSACRRQEMNAAAIRRVHN